MTFAAIAVVEAGGTTVVAPISLVNELTGAVGGVDSWRVSSIRVGVIGTNSPTLSSAAVASVNQPATSAIKAVPPEVNSETRPSDPTGTMTRLAPRFTGDQVEVGDHRSIGAARPGRDEPFDVCLVAGDVEDHRGNTGGGDRSAAQ